MGNMKVQPTITHKLINVTSICILLVMVLLLITGWDDLPDQIAGHYNFLGEPDRFGSKWEMLIYPTSVAFFFAMFTLIETFPSVWNVPASSNAENQEKVYRTTKSLLCFLKLETILVMTVIFSYTYWGKPLPVYFTAVYITVFLITLVYFMIRIYRFVDHK